MSVTLRHAAQERILILDGAMGTMIQQYDLGEDDFRDHPQLKDHGQPLFGNNDLLSVTRPEIIRAIHDKYFEAGADIVETNTFSSTTIAQEDYSLEDFVYEMNKAGASIARASADAWTAKTPDKPRFVAGSIGPTNRTASLSPDVNNPAYRAIDFDTLKVAYAEQIRGLIDGGVDALLIETIFDTLNAKAALFAAQEVMEEYNLDLPIMVSGTITDASGRTLSGQTAEAFLISISHAPVFSVGFNCALGAAQLLPHIDAVAHKTPFKTSAHPNAGLPNELGAYDQTPEEMASQMKEFLDRGVLDIMGGCCGTTPDHIRAMAELAEKYKPRSIEKAEENAG